VADFDLPDDRYLAVLERQRDRIARGLPFVAWDSDTTGDKDTEMSWGLCTGDLGAWPDKQDTMWPDRKPRMGRHSNIEPTDDPAYNHGRVYGVKHRTDDQPCPLDQGAVPSRWGCFYRCRVFNPKGNGKPSREEVLRLYDIRIKESKDK